MKKLLMIGSALALISTSAIASQARLLALGMHETDNDGMYHVSDARNIFLNPAYVNIYNNYVTAEYGQNGLNVSQDATFGTASNATLDNAAAPKAQGGFFKKQGDFVYGLYVGNESNTSSMLRIVGTSAAAAVNQNPAGTSKMLNSADNQFDLFFGGEAAVKWGGDFTYARGKEDARNAKDSAMALRTGVIGSNWDAHLNLSLASKAESTETGVTYGTTGPTTVKQEFEGKIGYHVGGSYVYSGNNRVFGYVKHYGWEQMDDFASYVAGETIGAGTAVGGQTGTVKGDFTSYYAGWGTHYVVNTTDKVFVSFSAKKTDINAKFSTKGEVRTLILPLSIAYEAVAKDWLTIRGSVTQNIWGTRDNKNYNSINAVGRSVIVREFGAQGKGSVVASTEVNGGATLTFGNLNVDGLVGFKNTGTLRTDNLLTRAAVTYKF